MPGVVRVNNQPINKKAAFLAVALGKFPVYIVESYVKQLEKMQKTKTKKTPTNRNIKNCSFGVQASERGEADQCGWNCF